MFDTSLPQLLLFCQGNCLNIVTYCMKAAKIFFTFGITLKMSEPIKYYWKPPNNCQTLLQVS